MPLTGKGRVLKAIKELKNSGDDQIRAVAISFFSQVISGTPVDSGRARNSWFLSSRSPSRRRSRRPDKSGKGSFDDLAQLEKGPVGGKVWYLSNRLPYIERLEYEGWSKQARFGWVRRAKRRIRNNIRRGRI